ncbi:MAG TPA: hypothetical protein PK622_02310 [Saprospiraceae bacterium]|jgi:hypothetical protein|nr:hypothetical protein [Saprospiraceae bacterium]
MKQLVYFLVGLLIFSCKSTSKTDNRYQTKNYLEVAKILDANPPDNFPLVIKLSVGKKQLIFIGTAHTRDITKQADSIDYYFHQLQPQIAFNEGGQVDKEKHYNSRNEAINQDAEIGQLKYLCDIQNIEMVNGDLVTAAEFNELFKIYSREQVLLYTCCERFFALYKNNWIDTTKGIEVAYQKDFIQYLESENVILTKSEKEFSYMTRAYKNFFGTDLDIYRIPTEKHDFLKDNGKLCEIGRSSKMVRDKYLLTTIEQALKKYDRIFVAFGGAHFVAVEPALKQIMNKYK